MISINTNLGSLIVQSNLKTSTLGLNQAIERMTTGFKINQAKDNAANFSISTNLTTKIGAYQIAEENVSMGLDLVTTASESLNLIEEKLTRLRALQEQASNGTYGEDSLKAINSEVNAIVDEINRLYRTTEYNGLNLFQSAESQVTPIMADYGIMTLSLADEPQAQSTSKFINEVTQTTPDIVVSDPIQLASALSNYNIVGISNAETLAQLATLVNSGTHCSGKTIVLTNDISLSAYSTGEGWTPIGINCSFDGNFDGNGHIISDLYINRSVDYQGLFGSVAGNSQIKNLGLTNVDITGGRGTGGIVARQSVVKMENCFVSGSVRGGDYVGGLVGYSGADANITSCYVTGTVSGNNDVGGLIGYTLEQNFNNNFSAGEVTGNDTIGGLIGETTDGGGITNCYSTSTVSGNSKVGALIGNGSASFTDCTYYSSVNPGVSIIGSNVGNIPSGITDGGIPPAPPTSPTPDPTDPDAGGGTGSGGTGGGSGTGGTGGTTPTPPPFTPTPAGLINFQVGIGSDAHSQISLDTSFSLEGIDELRGIGLDANTDFLSKLDDMLSIVTAKQTEYGAAQNRLESALEQISVSYENLVSTRSTIRDADIADESSNYIKMQILQQASATLLATANQTPSIALQLL